MYYLYMRHGSDFRYPDKLIVEYDSRYFERKKQTDWEEMSSLDVEELVSGKNSHYYFMDETQFKEIVSSWGGSETGYQRLNIHNLVKTSDYGDSYDEEDL